MEIIRLGMKKLKRFLNELIKINIKHTFICRRLKREAKIEDLPKTPNPTSTSFDQGTYLQPINLVTPKRSHPPLPKKPNMESDLELFGQYEEIVERQQLSKHA